MTAETIHTCSYSCDRPACIRAQRDELAARMTAETSNARGELSMADIRADAREPLQLLRERLCNNEEGWSALCQLMPMLAAAPPPADARGDVRGLADYDVRRLVGKLDQWRHCMSHNESYFGEPAGLVKSVSAGLARAVDPIYPPKLEPVDPLAGVTIRTATVPLSPLADSRCGCDPSGVDGLTCPDATGKPLCCTAEAQPMQQGGGEGELIARGVSECVENGDGFWRPCSGCYETSDGHNVQGFPYSSTFRCNLGGGCSECGGLGAVWDDTDYAAMALSQQPEARVYQCPRCATSMEVDPTAKAEARGVVDELLVNIRRSCDRARNSLPLIPTNSGILASLDHIENLAQEARAALTESRNGR